MEINKKFIINLQGSDFIKYEGLLDAFHQNGGKSIRTEIISNQPLIIQATVEGEKGTYQGIGDADDNNVNKLIVKHKIRMAETRAIARALRWYNNIGMCSVDELSGDEEEKKQPQSGNKCPKCGAKMAISQKGTEYCSNKCWLQQKDKSKKIITNPINVNSPF